LKLGLISSKKRAKGMELPTVVIPLRRRNPGLFSNLSELLWTPACAGVTKKGKTRGGGRGRKGSFVVFRADFCPKHDKTADKKRSFVGFLSAADLCAEAPTCPKDERAVQQAVVRRGFRMSAKG
jgi:hypothetical protein